MKSLICFIIVIILGPSYQVMANSTPLGLDLNKANAIEISAKYKVVESIQNPMGGTDYILDHRELSSLGANSVIASCDKGNKMVAAVFEINTARYNHLVEELAKKHKIITKAEVNNEGKMVSFENGDSFILVHAPDNSPLLNLIYITKNEYEKYSELES